MNVQRARSPEWQEGGKNKQRSCGFPTIPLLSLSKPQHQTNGVVQMSKQKLYPMLPLAGSKWSCAATAQQLHVMHTIAAQWCGLFRVKTHGEKVTYHLPPLFRGAPMAAAICERALKHKNELKQKKKHTEDIRDALCTVYPYYTTSCWLYESYYFLLRSTKNSFQMLVASNFESFLEEKNNSFQHYPLFVCK